MGKLANYRSDLEALHDEDAWEAYLRTHSELPGPRGNLELAFAFAEVAPAEMRWRFSELDAIHAPTNTPGEFVAFCGVLGLGAIAAHGGTDAVDALRTHASDARWRVREAAATALQLWADVGPTAMIAAVGAWALGNRYEQRAAVAAVAEPRLLKEPAIGQAALTLVDRVTATIVAATDARTEPFRVLRQALGYAWSVVIVGAPLEGKARFAAWAQHADPNIRWVVRENLKKARLERLDPAWATILGSN